MAVSISAPSNSLLLSLMIKRKEYNGTIAYITTYTKFKGNVYSIPMAFGVKIGARPKTIPFDRKAYGLEGTFISDDQKTAFDDTLARLASHRTSILGVHVGFGKTFLAIALIAHIGVKTLIIVPTSKKVLQNQWRSEVEKFIPGARVQLLQATTKIDSSCDVFIIGSHTVSRLARDLQFIPFVIVDELHLVLSSKGYENLLCIFPQYMLGLSATPYRLDGFNELVELFFGAFQVEKKLKRDYQVNVIFTPFKFKIEKTENGKLNWGSILNQQAIHEERNQLIADLICKNSNLKFLVLCKRVDQIKELSQKCREGGVGVQAVYGDIAPVKDRRTLVGSIQKLGVGFSDSSFNALIIASDVQDYFIQYFGRVLRRPDACPLIYDLVDDLGCIRKHYKAREEIYKTSGGKLKLWTLANLKNDILNIKS